jgi:DNA-binding GntR family transcriptional regulator
MTARGALAELEQEGIITIVHGVGTFVSSCEVHTDSISLQGFQNEMDKRETQITTEILSVVHGIAHVKLNELFKEHDGLYSCLTRLRTIEGTPVICQRSYVEQKFKDVFDDYTEEKSLYQFFSQKTGIMVTQGREIMTPVMLHSDVSAVLKITEPCTAFLSKRISISLNDQVVMYDEAYLPGPYFIMSSSKHGRNSTFKYIINKTGTIDSFDSFNDPDLWGDLI